MSLPLKCPQCDAPLEISPEDVVCTCAYCGYTFNINTAELIKNHFFYRPKNFEEIVLSVRNFLRKYKGVIRDLDVTANIFEGRLIYAPFWLVPFHASTWFKGYEKITVTEEEEVQTTDAEGNIITTTETYTRTAYRPIEATFEERGFEKILARRHASFYGYHEFVEKMKPEVAEPFNISLIKEYKFAFLNSEFGPDAAVEEAKNRIRKRHRKKAESRCTELFDIKTEIVTKEPIYIHAPFWAIRYEYRGKVYNMAVNGIDGRVLIGKIPLTLARRIVNAALSIFIVLLALFVVAPLILSIVGSYIAMSVSTFILLLLSLFPLRTVFLVELEKKG